MDPSDSPTLRLGTRASALARWQADWVAARLRELGVSVELVPITTTGDTLQAGPIETLGAQGVFTKELQRALLDESIDLAVHSLKDLPTDPVAGLRLAAVPEREAVGDVLVSRSGQPLANLPAGATIGTGSLRRQAQLRHARPDLTLADIRGNVDTRLRKLDEGQYDAIVLAEAGLVRLGLDGRITERLSHDILLPAVGQGALGIECRSTDARTLTAIGPLNDAISHSAVVAERALLAALRGGCLAPIGAWARLGQGELVLTARVLSIDGQRRLDVTHGDRPENAEALGQRAAADLIAQGAADLIATARRDA